MEADRFLGSTNENFLKKVAQLNGLARAIYLLFILFMRVGKNTQYIADKSETQSFFYSYYYVSWKMRRAIPQKDVLQHACSFTFARSQNGICSEVQFILKYICSGVCFALFSEAPRKIIDIKILILMISKGTCRKRQASLEIVLLWKYSNTWFLFAILFYHDTMMV